MNFRLNVHVFKYINCDLLFLVEKQPAHHVSWYSCPECDHLAEYMEDMTIVEEDMEETLYEDSPR